MRTISHTVTEAEAGKSVASVLRRELRLSVGLIARLKLIPGALMKNSLPVRTNERAFEGDVISAAVGESPAESGRLPLPFPILFEDEDILVIDKPAGTAVHGSRYDDTVLSVEEAVNAYYGREGLFHPVSRLDRGTTGVMAIAKNGWMHELLSEALHGEGYTRTYLGVACGIFAEKEGRIDLPIARIDGSAIKREIRSGGAPAITDYCVIKENNGLSLVRFRLLTGRTHQIRLHMAAIGHPLAGDWLYGTEDPSLIPRPALHSEKLELRHPLSGETFGITSPLPEDMARLMRC